MRKRTRNSFSYGSMWMSEAPRLSASIRSTFESLMTGAASEDLASAPRSISSSSVLTVSTSRLVLGQRVDVDLGEADRGHVVEGQRRARPSCP